VRVRPRCLHDGGGIGEEDRQPAKGQHRRRGASEAVGEPARAGSRTDQSTTRGWPRGGPAKDRKASRNEKLSRDRIACSRPQSKVFSQVGEVSASNS
jgi:hypothetical protein